MIHHDGTRRSLRLGTQLQSSMTIQENIGRLANQQEEIITILKGLKTQDGGIRTATERIAVDDESTALEQQVGIKHEIQGVGRKLEDGIADSEERSQVPQQAQEASSRKDVNHTHQEHPSNSSGHRPESNPFRTQQFMSCNQPSTILRPASGSVPYPNHPFLGHIQCSHGQFMFTSIGGDQTIMDASHHVVNTNSGNTTTTTIMNSNNDSSIRKSESTAS